MTDMDSGQTGDANAGSGDKQNSSVDANAKQLEELTKTVKDLSGQLGALQSGKDRGNHAAQKSASEAKTQVDALTQQINELTEAQEYLERYKDPTEAARQQMLDRMIREGNAPGQKGSKGETNAGQADLQGAQADADKELAEMLGVDMAGPEYAKAVAQGLNSLDALKAVNKANTAGGVGDGEALGIGGGTSGATGISGSQVQILQSQFDAEMEEKKDALQGNPWHIEEIKRKYREQGLEVW